MAAFPAWIELRCGPSRTFSALVWLAWLLAAGSLAYSVPHYDWPWLAAAGIALIVFHPAMGSSLRNRGVIRIHADGFARIGDSAFTWRPLWRANRLGILLEISDGERARSVLVCPGVNRPDDFRHLLVWCRFPPGGTRVGARRSE